jgi:predicted phosphodiesterase
MLSPAYDVTKLYIDAVGDFVLGEQVYFQMDLEDLQQVVMDQVFTTAIPWLAWFTQSMCGLFPAIEINAVPGNHGSMGKRMSKSANWDTILYLGWKARMSQAQNITFNIAEKSWYLYSESMGLTFLLVHGDQFPVKKGLVFNQMLDKAMRWQNALPRGFDCLVTGHFHSQQCFRISRIRCFITGSFVSDDDWVREELGLEGSCSQLLLGVTRGGVEWQQECLLAQPQ